jgi:hypothetical protein
MVLNITNTIPPSGLPGSGTNIYQGNMPPTSMLDVQLPEPVIATNAVLVITSGYDRGSTTNPRNTQVDELVFYERALPGTFGDWVLHHFNAAQLADVTISGPFGDPDADGAPNLLEFATGGDPLAPDAALGKLQVVASSASSFTFHYHERKNLGDVQRFFEASADFQSWSPTSPSSIVHVSDLGDTWLNQAAFPIGGASRMFFRIRYVLTSP